MIRLRDFGAQGNGHADDTHALRAALQACKEAGGGTLVVEPGTYRTAPLDLCSNLTIHLQAGATLLLSDRFEDYPPRKVRWEGVECMGYSPGLYGAGLENVTLEGRGTIDGNGAVWWAERRRRRDEGVTTPQTDVERECARLNPPPETVGSGGGGRETHFLRPCLIELQDCRGVCIRDVTVQNSAFWNTHLVYCEEVLVEGLRVRNPAAAPNGDGLSLDSCRHVRVLACDIDAGDDCLTLKSGIDADGRRVNRPCEDVIISGCIFRAGHGGVVCGSEISGGIRRIVVGDCLFLGTDRGIRMKARRGRGGYVEDFRVANCHMDEVICPLVINARYRCGADNDPHPADPASVPVDETTPRFSRIHITGISVNHAKAAACFIEGLPEMPIDGLTLQGIDIRTTADPAAKPREAAMAYGHAAGRGEGMLLRHVRDLDLRGVRVTHLEGDAMVCDNVSWLACEGQARSLAESDGAWHPLVPESNQTASG